MSQLYHFHWEGKEHSVSINQTNEGISLNFVDPQIIETLGGKVILNHTIDGWDYYTSVTRKQLQMLLELMQALENAIGKSLKDLPQARMQQL